MKRKIEVGKKYRHFKGTIYEVIAIAKDSETLEDLVIYAHDDKIWARPYEMFISEVDHKKYPDVKQKYRFEEID
jgi:hypothetical protein